MRALAEAPAGLTRPAVRLGASWRREQHPLGLATMKKGGTTAGGSALPPGLVLAPLASGKRPSRPSQAPRLVAGAGRRIKGKHALHIEDDSPTALQYFDSEVAVLAVVRLGMENSKL